MIAVIDNYDSFTYNLVHYLEEFEDIVDVYRNDQVSIDELSKYDHIIISPGPGLPEDIPFLHQVFDAFSTSKKILGVCLGLQAMIEYYKGELYNLSEVLHGRQGSCLVLKDDPLFDGISSPFLIGHYHSWGVNSAGIPSEVDVIAIDQDRRIMVVKHKTHACYGVQFHPESVLCPEGKKILYNWLKES